jgi:hypothetical protein
VTENDQATPAEGEAKPKRSRRFWWLLAAGFVVLLVLVVAFLPQFSTMQPAYYGRYPGMSARMENWKNSTHARVGCVSCHVEPGVKGLVGYGLASIPGFYSQLFLGTQTTNLLKPPSVAACQKCHTNYRQVSPNGDLLIPHKAHVVVLKMNCVECHKNLVHSANEKGYNSPKMATCLDKCHNGKTASNKCTDCHTRKQTPESHAQKNWLEVHSEQAATGDCGKCHGWTQNYCADCHKNRPASHVGNWKTGHAAAAKQRGKGCLVCHGGEKFCKECHD